MNIGVKFHFLRWVLSTTHQLDIFWISSEYLNLKIPVEDIALENSGYLTEMLWIAKYAACPTMVGSIAPKYVGAVRLKIAIAPKSSCVLGS
jgi:hypothetical protein